MLSRRARGAFAAVQLSLDELDGIQERDRIPGVSSSETVEDAHLVTLAGQALE